MAVKIESARIILDKLESLEDGNILENISGLFDIVEERLDILNFIYRIDLNIKEIVIGKIKEIEVFKNFNINISNNLIYLNHKLIANSRILKKSSLVSLSSHRINSMDRTYLISDEITMKRPIKLNPLEGKLEIESAYNLLLTKSLEELAIKDRYELFEVSGIKRFLYQREYPKYILGRVEEEIEREEKRYEKELEDYEKVFRWQKYNQNKIDRDLDLLKEYLDKNEFTGRDNRDKIRCL